MKRVGGCFCIRQFGAGGVTAHLVGREEKQGREANGDEERYEDRR
jgi:hypothetical protein